MRLLLVLKMFDIKISHRTMALLTSKFIDTATHYGLRPNTALSVCNDTLLKSLYSVMSKFRIIIVTLKINNESLSLYYSSVILLFIKMASVGVQQQVKVFQQFLIFHSSPMFNVNLDGFMVFVKIFTHRWCQNFKERCSILNKHGDGRGRNVDQEEHSIIGI